MAHLKQQGIEQAYRINSSYARNKLNIIFAKFKGLGIKGAIFFKESNDGKRIKNVREKIETLADVSAQVLKMKRNLRFVTICLREGNIQYRWGICSNGQRVGGC